MTSTAYLKGLFNVIKYAYALKVSLDMKSVKPIMYSYSGLTIVSEMLFGSKPIDFICKKTFNVFENIYAEYQYFTAVYSKQNNNQDNHKTKEYFLLKYNAIKYKLGYDHHEKIKKNNFFGFLLKNYISEPYDRFCKEKFMTTASEIIDESAIQLKLAVNALNELFSDVKPVSALLIGAGFKYFASTAKNTIHTYPLTVNLLITSYNYFDLKNKGIAYIIPPAITNPIYEIYNNPNQLSTKVRIEKCLDTVIYTHDYIYKVLITENPPNGHDEL